jgi:hypothetical protein
MGITAKKWVKVQNFDGAPKSEDFRLEEETLAEIKDGGEWVVYNVINIYMGVTLANGDQGRACKRSLGIIVWRCG